MSHHDNTTLTQPRRAELWKSYVHIYLCIRADGSDALRDNKDGHVLAWTSWDEATRFAAGCGMIVVNWHWFVTRTLSRLPDVIPAARIIVTTPQGVFRYHAELDASHEELRTLSAFRNWELQRRPGIIARQLKAAKVWPEEDQS